MIRNVAIAVGAAIVGAAVILLYNVLIAPIGPSHRPKPCTPGNCAVAVNVYIDCSVADNIFATPDRAPVAKGNPDIRIEWTLYKSGFAFADVDGIDFHGDTQFYNGRKLADDKFEWFDHNQDSGPHKYTIKLLHSGVACPPLDPGIINGQ
jgi:hypothetical protein